MKFTSEDLMKAMGLSVGDRIHLFQDEAREFDEGIYQIIKEQPDDYPRYYVFENINDSDDRYNIKSLVDLNFEILPRQKCVGDLKCGTQGKDGQNTCGDCPVRIICNHHTCKELGCGNTLYEYLETYKTNLFEDDVYDFDQEIYDLLKARLDKEVE